MTGTAKMALKVEMSVCFVKAYDHDCFSQKFKPFFIFGRACPLYCITVHALLTREGAKQVFN